MKILVTGAAGFIGSKLAYELARRGDEVVGIDNLNSYYDPNLKLARLKEFFGITPQENAEKTSCIPETGGDGNEVTYHEMVRGKKIQSPTLPNMWFMNADISDRQTMEKLFEEEKFDKVMNLAAQAGVRYSLKNPYTYIENNVMGFMIILECCRQNGIKHLVYASSSSVYGMNDATPFSENDDVSYPVSIYAATKKANELMAHSYGKLYNLPTTGLRYFTVYGPWGRPDMAPMLFANAIRCGKTINVFNNGDLIRDFTYIDDIVNGTIKVLDKIPESENCLHNVPAKIYNIGCSNPVKLMDFITEIEKNMGVEANKNFMPMQKGDVYQTNADTTLLEQEVGYKPKTNLTEGIAKFIKWYKTQF